jgi:hypothetical protein
MPYDQIGVARVQDTPEELFVLMWLDSQLPQREFMQTSAPMNESDLHTHLQHLHYDPQEIAAFLQRARAHAAR